MNEIVMGGGNHMNVDKFSYKGEFQDRGAGHIHGNLWVKIHAIEKLRKLADGRLITPKNYDKEGLTESYTTPFNGLSDAYRKLKNDNFGDYDNDQPIFAIANGWYALRDQIHPCIIYFLYI